MGNDQSSPEARYKRELLKLSWNLVLTVQEQAKSQQEALEEASRNSAESKDSKMSSVFVSIFSSLYLSEGLIIIPSCVMIMRFSF